MTRTIWLASVLLVAGCFDFSRFAPRTHDLGLGDLAGADLSGQTSGSCGALPSSNLLAPNASQFTASLGGWSPSGLTAQPGDESQAGCLYPATPRRLDRQSEPDARSIT